MPPKPKTSVNYKNAKTGTTVQVKPVATKRPVVKIHSAQELMDKLTRQREEVAALKEYFADLFPVEFMVSDAQFGVWIRQYGFANTIVGLDEAATKMNKVSKEIEEGDKDAGEPWTRTSLVHFASWVMSQERKAEA